MDAYEERASYARTDAIRSQASATGRLADQQKREADAQHRQADALERIAYVLERLLPNEEQP